MLVHPDAPFRSALERHRDALREARAPAAPAEALARALVGASRRATGSGPT